MISTIISPKIEKANTLATITKIALILEYNGTSYHGFQLQDGAPTIQGELEKALWKLTGEWTRILGASRTDAGVHAKAQVVSFRTQSSLPLKAFINGLNYYLPSDIAVRAAYKVNNSFNVKRQATSRQYNYYVLNSPTRSPLRKESCYLVTPKLNVDDMNLACQYLLGEKDFASFTSPAELRNTVRKVYEAGIRQEGDLIIFNMVANSFLLHQVRNTIGSLVRVGLGKMSADEFCSIIEAKKPGLAGPTAPARGLCLIQINYPHLLEEYDENL